MSESPISSQHVIDPGSALQSFAGLDPTGRRVAWLGRPRVTPTEALPVPRGLSDADLHLALSHVPAWRLTRLAALEPGGVVLVAGDGWLAQDVLRMSRLRGCLWRGQWGGQRSADADWWASDGQPLASPRPPDAAILLRITRRTLDTVVEAVQDRGIVVVAAVADEAVDHGFYPHVHRRGLRLEFTDLTTSTEEDLRGVLRLMRAGLAPVA